MKGVYEDWGGHWSGYPCAIVNDRYTGTYSGGEWVAFPLEAAPDGCAADDGDTVEFWSGYVARPEYPVGLGNTPAEALADLEAKARGEKPWAAGVPRWSPPEPWEVDFAEHLRWLEGGAP